MVEIELSDPDARDRARELIGVAPRGTRVVLIPPAAESPKTGLPILKPMDYTMEITINLWYVIAAISVAAFIYRWW